jgi:1,4-dihydroxy-2-naphthoate octaprenyltransferase
MLHRSTVQLLRFHFSFFLMPVYLFAISQCEAPDWGMALITFIILHLLVYPASNGYNSYMDRDEGSIGGIKNPLQPTKQLFYLTVIMDCLAVAASLIVSRMFALGIAVYILASRAYSYRKIRLKQYPVTGYLTVMLCQGALTFWIVYFATENAPVLHPPVLAALASSLLIGGFYPLTQIYQHEADRKDGVITISAALGYRGTFIFTAVVYTLAILVMAVYFFLQERLKDFFTLNILMLPILVYFFIWASKVWKDTGAANFSNTMKMNLLACTCTNAAFVIIIIQRSFE